MTIIHVVSIKEVISPHLTASKTALDFFENLSNVVSADLRIDFSQVKSISHSFAYQYLVSKLKSKKRIMEINIPQNVCHTIDLVQSEIEETKRRKKKY